ncbi:MAG: tyrosine-type recombinase/integrase [Sterolibacterium sp.]|nr:tyrosine-type recombinase/integrase [Sterolibacterium sp.]
MGHTRTRGITLEKDGCRTVNKVWRGERIFARLGQVSQEEAERWLASELARRESDGNRRRSHRPLFADCAKRYLIESKQKRSVEVIAWHIKLLLPYIGALEIHQVHDATLEAFKADRRAGLPAVPGKPARPVSPTTINRSLEVVRTVLTRAARSWRDESSRPWLDMAPPLITMEEERQRPPHPLNWEEQDLLFRKLPPHLQKMALFDVNTGLRDENVCGLRWSWEQKVQEVGRSVFIVPAEEYKTGVPHVVILNDAAWSIVEKQRELASAAELENGTPKSDFVFTFRNGDRVNTMNNSGWQTARTSAGLVGVRVHDLRHTFATRLRLAGVAQEDRNALMGHKARSMPEHYAGADIGRLIEIANRVLDRQGTRTLLRVVNG